MALEIEESKEHHIGKWIFAIIFFVVVAVTGWYAYRWYTTGDLPPLPFLVASAGIKVDESDVTKKQTSEHTAALGSPRYLSIPTLGVNDARIYPVGLGSDNMLTATDNINDVGWYEESAQPGSGGVILVSGHNRGTSKDGVFFKLGSMQIGDGIMIERGDGQMFTYEVKELYSIDIEKFASEGMKTLAQPLEKGKETLSITTGDGKWVPRLGTFDSRIILRAVTSSEY